MNNENILLLNSEIRSIFEILKDIEIGTDEYAKAIEPIVKLIGKSIDSKKIENETEDKKLDREISRRLKLREMRLEDNFKRIQLETDREFKEKQLELDQRFKEKQLELDNDFKERQLQNEIRDRKIQNGIAIAGMIITNMLIVWGTKKSLKFEETGTVTTIMGRGFINKLLPRK